ncbi:hypothetical protein Shyhy02_43980 [Streptomyces hygroscopicus subsp. hygroscopicus]|nr:hypothetical protein Shyhy02_43980 [Streptomyces hygroscopicus subsp. hygroscopicus]
MEGGTVPARHGEDVGTRLAQEAHRLHCAFHVAAIAGESHHPGPGVQYALCQLRNVKTFEPTVDDHDGMARLSQECRQIAEPEILLSRPVGDG